MSGIDRDTRQWANSKRKVVFIGALVVAIAAGMVLTSGLAAVVQGAVAPTANAALATPTSCRVGHDPTIPAYDPVDHEVYVPNEGSGNITVIKGTCTVAATITLPRTSEPFAAAFDPATNCIYVTDVELNQVYVISGTSIRSTITGGFDEPYGLGYDPAAGSLAVTNFAGNTVSFIDAGDTVSQTVGVGAGPDAVDYDLPYNTLDVANGGSDNVTILNAHFPFDPVGNLAVGSDPQAVSYDPEDQEILVDNTGSNNVSVISGYYLPLTISGFNVPLDAAWSQAHLRMYVTNNGASGKIFEVNGSSIAKRISDVKGADGVTYDDNNNDIYVTEESQSEVYVTSS
jgi:DNA-binding beta-propeller fold protein YncE